MNEYLTKFSFIRQSANGPNFAYFTIFKNDLNIAHIAHGGFDDNYSKTHRLTKTQIFECVQKSSSDMNNMQKADEAAIATIKSQVIHSLRLVKSNLPITTANTSSKT